MISGSALLCRAACSRPQGGLRTLVVAYSWRIVCHSWKHSCMHSVSLLFRRHPGVCLPPLRHGDALSLQTRLAEFLLPGELLQLGLFGGHIGLERGDLHLQDFTLACTLALLLLEVVALLQLRS